MPVLTLDFTNGKSGYIDNNSIIPEVVDNPHALSGGDYVAFDESGSKLLLPETAGLKSYLNGSDYQAPADVCYGVGSYELNSSDYVFWGSATKLWRMFSGTAAVDVTRSAGAYSTPGARNNEANLWHFTSFGGIMIATNHTNEPQYGLATGLFADLTGWTAGDTAYLVAAIRNYLCFYDLYQSGNFYHSRVFWGDGVDDAGNLPSTWTAGPDNTAGQRDLLSTKGGIAAVLALGTEVFIYKKRSIIRQTWIGGQEVFKFLPFSTTVGVFGPNAVCSFMLNGKEHHFFVGPRGCYIHDGNTITEIGIDTIRGFITTLTEAVSTHLYYIQAQAHTANDEIWVLMPTTTVTYILIWNYRLNVWYPLMSNSTQYLFSLASYPSAMKPESYLMLFKGDPATSNHVFTAEQDTVSTYYSYMERSGLVLPIPGPDGNPIVQNMQAKSLGRVWLEFKPVNTTHVVELQIAQQYEPNQTLSWVSQGTITVGASGSGRQQPYWDLNGIETQYLAYRIRHLTSSSSGDFRVVRLHFEYQLIGEASF